MSLVRGFAEIAAAHAARPAIAAGGWHASYGTLDQTANRIANAIVARGANPGQRAAILMQHDGPQVAAALGVLKAGCVGIALNPTHPPAHLAATLAHGAPALLIADANHRDLAARIAGGIERIDFDDAGAGFPADDPRIDVPEEQTAFLVYTSGSTGTPKAIMRTHALLRQNARRHAAGVDIRPEDRLTLLAALGGGQGIGIMWTALLAGAALCPFPVAERGFAGLPQWLDEAEITTLVASASVFRGLVRVLGPGQRFARIRAVRIASEMATAEDFAAFRRHFPAECRFVHSYGCSEVGNVTQHVMTAADTVDAGRLPVGVPAPDLSVTIIDEDGRALPAGETGTVAIAGPHLAAGYWREPALTAERFESMPGGVRRFRSGDRGRIDAQGRLVLAGRSDSQVKIAGQRVDLAAIEAALADLPGVAQAAVCAEPGPSARLSAFVVAKDDPPPDAARLRRGLRATLPRHMIPTAFATIDALPLNAHGKIDRAALLARRGRPAASGAGSEAPAGKTETALAAIWAEALGVVSVGRGDDFFALGGDSLSAAIVAAQIHDRFAIDIGLAPFASHSTLAAFAQAVDARRISASGDPGEPPLRRLPRDGRLALSITQMRLWQFSQSAAGMDGYRSLRRYHLRGPLDRAAFARALDAVVARHEILRTSFPLRDGAPTAAIAAEAGAALAFHDPAGRAGGADEAEALARAELARIADLGTPPLARFVLAKLGPEDHVFYRLAHHILADAASWRIFLDDLESAYGAVRRGDAPFADAEPGPDYADFAQWQHRLLRADGPAWQATLAWWRAALAAPWPPFSPRFARRQRVGGLPAAAGDITRSLGADVSARFEAFARARGVTLYAAALAAAAAVLARACATPRLVVGSYVSLRNRSALQRMMGDFTALTPVPLAIDTALGFGAWLDHAAAQARAAIAHAAPSPERLGEALAPAGVALPAVACVFSLRSDHSAQRFDDLEIDQPIVPARTMPWGFSLVCSTGGPALRFTARFDAGLYEPEGVAAVLDALIGFIEHGLAAPDTPIGALLGGRQAPGRWRRALARLTDRPA